PLVRVASDKTPSTRRKMMTRKLCCIVFLTTLLGGVAVADEFVAAITKVEDGKITFHKGRSGPKGENDITLPAAKDIKVLKGKIIDIKEKKFAPGEGLPEGLKHEALKDIQRNKPVAAWFVTDDGGKTIKELWLLLPVEKKKGGVR